MSLFWLAYRQPDAFCVLIVEAHEALMARLKAEMAIPGINARFAEAHELDPARAAMVPVEAIGRLLDAEEARQLLDRLEAMAVPKKPPAPSVRRPAASRDRAGSSR